MLVLVQILTFLGVEPPRYMADFLTDSGALGFGPSRAEMTGLLSTLLLFVDAAFCDCVVVRLRLGFTREVDSHGPDDRELCSPCEGLLFMAVDPFSARFADRRPDLLLWFDARDSKGSPVDFRLSINWRRSEGRPVLASSLSSLE